MVETFFGFKKPPFGDSPDAKQLFASQSWTQVKARLQFLVDHHGAGLLTGEVGAGKSTAARTFAAGLNPNLYKILYLHWTCGSALDLLRQLALELDLVPAHYRGDLVATLIAYNAGPRPKGTPLPRNGETPAYVLHVLHAYRWFSKHEATGPCSPRW